MPTAAELLARTATPETEAHIVIGNDRVVTVPPELRTVAVQFDHNIETVTFDCPRYWDEHDMSEMMVFVNYMRSDSVHGQYHCSDVTVDAEDDRIMHFTWTITGNVTAAAGRLSFLVCIKAANENGELENQWSSLLNQEMTIEKGMNTSGEIESFEPDLITSILVQLETVKTRANRQVDWDETNTKANTYVKNRPLYVEEFSATWNGDISSFESRLMSELQPTGDELVGGTVRFINVSTGEECIWPIVGYFKTLEELEAFNAAQTNTDYVTIVNGGTRDTLSPLMDYITVSGGSVGITNGLGYVCNDPEVCPPGIYANSLKDIYQIVELSWNVVHVDPRYEHFFGSLVSNKDNSDINDPTIAPTLNPSHVTDISITEAADGTVTMYNTLASGSETIIITPDVNGRPVSLTYNGKTIPITWGSGV